MKFETLFQQTNALQLLRERNAWLILSFLKENFPEGRNSVSQEELTAALAAYLETLDEKDFFEEADLATTDLFNRYRNKAKSLLRDWEGVKKRYLRGVNNAAGQYEYSITEHVVRVWHWLESLENQEFTGTQSRLEDIFEKIKRVLDNSREKTDADRVAELRQKQADIAAEISAIESGKNPYKPFDNLRLREEYEGLLDQIRALATDFKTVESHFERIRTNMLRQYAAQEGSKGDLLSAALDARDELDNTPQGQSFNGFFEELRNPYRTRLFEERGKELLAILEERQVEHGNSQLLLRLYRHLLSEAQPVLEANRRISDRIMRIVAENNSQNRQLLRERLAAVKSLLLTPGFSTIFTDSTLPFWEIDNDSAKLYLPLEKSLKTQASEQQLNFKLPQKQEETKPELPVSDELSLAIRLRSQIAKVLEHTPETSLAAVVEQFPMEGGLIELLAYLNIATQHDNRHFIQADVTERVPLNDTQLSEGPKVFLMNI